jgi:hypothetical protein
VVAATYATDNGVLLAYQRATATETPDWLRAGFRDDDGVRRDAPVVLETEPAEWEPYNDLVFANIEHPDAYDGLWCPTHGRRVLPRAELVAALNANRALVLTHGPQR